MPIELDEDLYKWLVAMKVLLNDSKRIANGKVQLSLGSSVQLENGTTVGRLIKTIIRNQKESSPSSLEHLKEGATPAVKNANWNVIWSCFPLLRMEFDTQIKSLIVEGDNSMVGEVVRQLSEKYPTDTSKVEVAQGQNISTIGKQTAQKDDKKKSVAEIKTKAPAVKSDAVDMTKLDQKKDPASADSSLEFLLLLLCQSLNLPPNEVLGLFTNQNKYLAHVIAKGLKGDFTQVIQFYSSIRDSYMPKMLSLFEHDPKSESFTLYALKPGLVSKNKEVVQLTIDILKQLDAYEWFVGESKCLLTFILGLKRHPDLADDFADLLISLTRNNFTEFITKHYKPQFENVAELLDTSGELLRPLAESEVREQLDKSGVVSEWLQLALQNIENDDKQSLTTRLICFRFITKLWVSMPGYIEDDEESYDRLLLTMKKDWASRNFNEFVSLTVEMINLLVALAREKNPAAKLIYNLLAIVLSQTITSEEHRVFLLQNFTHICRQFPSIPLGFLLQNYAAVPNMQVYDYQFLSALSASPNIDVKSATIIGEVALKFFQESVVNAACSTIILKVVGRFSRDMVDFAGKTVKTLMAVLYATEKNKKSTIEKPLPLYNNRKGVPSVKPPTNTELETQIVAAQQRAQIVELVKKLIMQNNEPINEKIRPYIVATSLQIKQFNKQGHKGLNALLSLYGNQREIEQEHINENRQRRASESSRLIGSQDQQMKESQQRQKILTKVTAPADVMKHLEFLHDTVLEKKKRLQKQSETKQLEEQRKKLQVKKEMEKVKFLKGFGGEAQLFEEGYWERKLDKKTSELEVVEMDLLEPRDLQFIEIILRRYHKVLRQLFLRYTTTGFTTKNATNFDQQAQRTETISNTELVRLLKDYKLFFLTDLTENQLLVRDVNVKVLKKRETQEFDFAGFEQYIIQFVLVVFSRPHTVTIKSEGKVISEKRELKNLMPAQILEVFFKYLRTVTEERGENTLLFDDPDSAYFNESQVIREFNKKLEQDPSYILPQGYKKVTDRSMTFEPKVKLKVCQGLSEKYADCSEVLDEILFNALGIHTLELMSAKATKCKARPNVFVNVGSKLLEKSEKVNPQKAALESANRMRELISSAGDIKHSYNSEKLMEKKNLTLGMKLGLSQIPYKFKLLGEQVAYVLDDMLLAVEQGRTTLEKPKVVNEAMKLRQKMEEDEKRAEELRNKRREQRIKQLSNLKQSTKVEPDKPDQKQLKKKKDAERQKKKQEEMQKYLTEQKVKLEAKKKEEQDLQKKKEQEQKSKKKKEIEQAKKKFEDFNQKQIEKFKGELKTKADAEELRKKKQGEQAKLKQEKYKKLKSRIHEEDEKLNQAKQKINEQLTELYNSGGVQELLKRHDYVLRTLFDFLLKSTFTSLTEKKHNNEVIYETWLFFNIGFKVTPVILDVKEMQLIFQSLTRNKHQTKDYYVGLDYQEFCQALLRAAVKHKSVFNKLSAKIKDGKLQGADVSEVLKGEDKNEFEQPKEVDLNGLLKEEDASNGKLLDNYGDISKADENTLRGLIYYLKLPEDKNQLELRFRNVQEQSSKRRKTKKQELKEKLNDDYSNLAKSPKPAAKSKKARVASNEAKEGLNQSAEAANESAQAADV